MGKAALEGLQGVRKVERGMKNWQETNTVHYDPSSVTVDDMVEVLQDARTYIGTEK